MCTYLRDKTFPKHKTNRVEAVRRDRETERRGGDWRAQRERESE